MDKTFIINFNGFVFRITGKSFEQIKPKIIEKLYKKYGGIGCAEIVVVYSTLIGEVRITTDVEVTK